MTPSPIEVTATEHLERLVRGEDPLRQVIGVSEEIHLGIRPVELEGVGRVVRSARLDRPGRNQGQSGWHM